MLNGKTILLIISGGIAAYKSLELIRLLKKSGASVRCILTKGGEQFVTPLSVSSLSEEKVYTELWSLTDEAEMGHIRLSRESDLIVVAPASANLISRMAHGRADDLASTTLLASDKPVIVCPAMNPMMWENPATNDNIALLKQRGVRVFEPASGDMACGEVGAGRLPEAIEIFGMIERFFEHRNLLSGMTALVTAGPTYEPIDPVRFIGNRSSGKQGYAIAEALAEMGAKVTLVSGPTSLPAPANVKTIRIETAAQMLEFCQKSLPCDIAVCAAAVADWAPKDFATSKIKKSDGASPSIELKQNADILSTIAQSAQRPRLVIGFAAETDNLIENARAKLVKKRCDWVVANSVDAANPVFGSDQNKVYLISSNGVEEWANASKDQVARDLALRIATFFQSPSLKDAAE